VSAATGAVLRELGGFDGEPSLLDRRHVSVHAGGSALRVLNALARAHGALCWRFEELSDDDAASAGGRRYQLSVHIAGYPATFGFYID
jgi:hypothetical protein